MVARVRGSLAVLGLAVGALLVPGDSGRPQHGGAPGPGEPAGPAAAASTSTTTTSTTARAGPGRPTTAAPTTAAPEPRSFTLVATGDVLLHEPLWDQAAADAAARGREGYDFAPLMAGIEPLVGEADLAVCHLETPLGPRGGPFSSYPSFSVPPAIAPALDAVGYDACTTASNHTYDQGASGVDRTLDALDAAGLAHAGSARTPQEADALTILDAGPADVALLSYTYGFNGIPPPGGEHWRSEPIDEATIRADAAAARESGAEVVVVALHWGDEYRSEPNAQQSDLAPRLIGSPDIDLLLGHHAHVVQPIEAAEGGWIVYGMGNAVANQATLGPEKAEGLLVRFTFAEVGGDRWDVSRAEFAPLLLDRGSSPRRLVVVADELDDPDVQGAERQRLQEAWDRTTEVVRRRGGADAGLRPIPPT